MTELDALLAAVRDSPGDDTPRLVLADWLEENASVIESACSCSIYIDDPTNPFRGEPGYRPERDPASGHCEGAWTNCKSCNDAGGTPGVVRTDNGYAARSEFIRVQIELVRFESFSPSHRKEFDEVALVALEKRMTRLERGDSESIKIAKVMEEGGRLYRERHEKLHRRERELLSGYWAKWVNPSSYSWMLLPSFLAKRSNSDLRECWFHRGFLSRIRCSWEDWSHHADAILADPWVPGLDEVELATWPGHLFEPLWVVPREACDPKIWPSGVATILADRAGVVLQGCKARWPAVRNWKLPTETRDPITRMRL